MPTQTSLRRRLLACILAGGLSMSTANTSALAGNCGCEASCQTCPRVTSGCTCNCSKGTKLNCVKKAFQCVTSKLDKLLSFDFCGCHDAGCDDGCDAAMMDELMVPMPMMMHDHSGHDHSGHDHSGHDHSGHDHMSPPKSQGEPVYHGEVEMNQLRDSGESHPDVKVEVMPPPVRLQDPPAEPALDEDRGSLFDTLPDPFNDDDARAKTYRPIRPSAYQNRTLDNGPGDTRSLRTTTPGQIELRPISRRELPNAYPASSRRVSNSR